MMRFSSGTCLWEWRKNEMKSIKHVKMCNYMNTTHGTKYLHIMQYTYLI